MNAKSLASAFTFQKLELLQKQAKTLEEAKCRPASMELRSVSWGPNANKSLVKSVSLQVKPAEFLAIVGPNGSGKTSLLRCLYRINQPSQGQVFLDGESLWDLSAHDCAKRIATVLQDAPGDLGLSVFDMVEIGLTPKSHTWRRSKSDSALIEEAMSLMNVEHLAHRLFSTLSGGERQRVLIARALAQRPDVLILDEPTNHLDIRHQLELLDLLAKLPCTLIISLHDLSLASTYADRVLIMQDGEMQACSAPSQAFTEQSIKQVFDVDTVIDCHPITQRPRFSFYL
ncbi:ABC transporter ATP-binding protein [Marinomonas sp. C2222]|uniref:ABC transporter ATP-binding protein n=1 Tax=Marinomonas sargassi TaxID=2984494 RepID=A0ABT2YT97_9GAMM|nr:ABC transporter ATP-binding protein [Marinomonas sargassi]MCV2403133.1 ABC transporter ATP-binding protein [Marinomonas sargassi]